MFLATILLLALTRAEIIQRMRAPVVTQSDGLIKVYANCDEDIRSDYQSSVAGFAANTVKMLYDGLRRKSLRQESPSIVILLGNERTNNTEVVTKVATNDNGVVSRIYLKSPAYADVDNFRAEIVRAFYRAIEQRELSREEARKVYRSSDPAFRIADERARLEAWLKGTPLEDDAPKNTSEEEIFAATERNLARMRKIYTPGTASRRDIMTFASRMHLSNATFDEKFIGGYDSLSFDDAIRFVKVDPLVKLAALRKVMELSVISGGRGEYLQNAGRAYGEFLAQLVKGEKSDKELEELLEQAHLKLRAAYTIAE